MGNRTGSCIKDAICRISCKPAVFFVFWIILTTILPNFFPVSLIKKEVHGLEDRDGYFANGNSRYELNYDAVVHRADLTNSEIVLVIAHPDDESMFFGPSLIELSKKNYNNNINVVCFSNGDFDSLGKIREQEFYESGRILGFKNLKVLGFEDNIHKSWDYELIKQSLIDTIQEWGIGTQEGESKRNIVFLTFDEFGVSNHPNHISLYNGVNELMKDVDTLRKLEVFQGFKEIKFWNLKSWNLLVKYSGQALTNFEIIWKLFQNYYESDLKDSKIVDTIKEYHSIAINKLPPPVAPFLQYQEGKNVVVKIQSDLSMWFVNMSCMSYAHFSQIVWFRWFWLAFSKYLNSNELELVASIIV